MNSLSQLVWISLDDRLFPAIKPAVPELHTHERPLFAMLVKEFLQLGKIVICLGAEISCHKDIVINQRTRLKRSPPRSI